MARARTLGLLALYVGAQAMGLALALPFRSAGLQSTSNPNSAFDPVFYIALIVIAPLVILWLARRRGGLAALRTVILLAIGASLSITLDAVFALALPAPFYLPPAGAAIVVDPALTASTVVAVVLFLTLLMEPQWYVVDAVGFLAGGALIAIFGISFGILPAFILLIALAIYDAIAVYRTKHMIRLADVVTDLKLPILMVMPSAGGYDYTRSGGLKVQQARPVEEREAVFMGLGDVVIPGVLVASAYVWLPVHPVFAGLGANLWAALGALVGSLIGYAVLMRYVMRGNPQAGLPLLNGGALVGYALTYLLLFHDPSLGLSLAL